MSSTERSWADVTAGLSADDAAAVRARSRAASDRAHAVRLARGLLNRVSPRNLPRVSDRVACLLADLTAAAAAKPPAHDPQRDNPAGPDSTAAATFASLLVDHATRVRTLPGGAQRQLPRAFANVACSLVASPRLPPGLGSEWRRAVLAECAARFDAYRQAGVHEREPDDADAARARFLALARFAGELHRAGVMSDAGAAHGVLAKCLHLPMGTATAPTAPTDTDTAARSATPATTADHILFAVHFLRIAGPLLDQRDRGAVDGAVAKLLRAARARCPTPTSTTAHALPMHVRCAALDLVELRANGWLAKPRLGAATRAVAGGWSAAGQQGRLQ